MTKIEELRKEADEIKVWLEDLKKNLSKFSEADKQKKVEWIRAKIDETKQKIQAEINSLADKTDEGSKKKKEEAEALLNSFEETTSLYSSVINPTENTSGAQKEEQPQTTEQQGESKSFLDKTKEAYTKTKNWIWDQWNDVWDKGKWKTEWWKNLLRTAWFVATWVWAISLAYKWVKKLRNWAFWKKKEGSEDKKEKETKEETKEKDSGEKKWFWDRPVWKFLKWTAAVLWVWTWVYYLTHGLYTKNRWLNDLWNRGKWKKLVDSSTWAKSTGNNETDPSTWTKSTNNNELDLPIWLNESDSINQALQNRKSNVPEERLSKVSEIMQKWEALVWVDYKLWWKLGEWWKEWIDCSHFVAYSLWLESWQKENTWSLDKKYKQDEVGIDDAKPWDLLMWPWHYDNNLGREIGHVEIVIWKTVDGKIVTLWASWLGRKWDKYSSDGKKLSKNNCVGFSVREKEEGMKILRA